MNRHLLRARQHGVAFVMSFFVLIGLMSLSGQSQQPVSPPAAPTTHSVSVRAVTLEVPVRTLGLKALTTPWHDDDALFESLKASIASGESRVVGDELIVTRSGQKALIQAVDEVRYAQDFAAKGFPHRSTPGSVGCEYLGARFEIEPTTPHELTTDAEGRPCVQVDLQVAPTHTAHRGLSGPPCPPDAHYPLIHSCFHETSASLTVLTGHWCLLSVAPSPDHAGASAEGFAQVGLRAAHLTFVRIDADLSQWDEKAMSKTLSAPICTRITTLTLRVPAVEAVARLVAASAHEDHAAWWQHLKARAVAGDVPTVSVASLSTRSGLKARTQAHQRVWGCDEFEPGTPSVPTDIKTLEIGLNLEMEPTSEQSGDVTLQVVLERCRLPHWRYWPDQSLPGPQSIALRYQPEETVNVTIDLEPGEVRCLCATSVAASAEVGQEAGPSEAQEVDVTFIFNLTPPNHPNPADPPNAPSVGPDAMVSATMMEVRLTSEEARLILEALPEGASSWSVPTSAAGASVSLRQSLAQEILERVSLGTASLLSFGQHVTRAKQNSLLHSGWSLQTPENFDDIPSVGPFPDSFLPSDFGHRFGWKDMAFHYTATWATPQLENGWKAPLRAAREDISVPLSDFPPVAGDAMLWRVAQLPTEADPPFAAQWRAIIIKRGR